MVEVGSDQSIKTTQRAKTSAAQLIDALPHWLQPGASTGLHQFLQVILICLNVFLASCSILQLFSPHFEIMFLLSIGLSASYFYFMAESGRIHAKAQESVLLETQETERTVDGTHSGRKKNPVSNWRKSSVMIAREATTAATTFEVRDTKVLQPPGRRQKYSSRCKILNQ